MASIMSRLRFEMIGAALHIKDDTSDKDNNLVKFVPFMNKLSAKFREYYNLEKNITIDESMIHFKGRSDYTFYISMKPIKYGFKLHVLTESSTGYCYNYLLDLDNLSKYLKVIKSEKNNGNKYIEFTVLSLMSYLPFKGYNLFMDFWYNSISLAKKLLDQGITLTSPVKKIQ